MTPRWGGRAKNRDNAAHFTIWRGNDQKGERLSWDQTSSGVRNVHHTDQTTQQHSSDPRTWRWGK